MYAWTHGLAYVHACTHIFSLFFSLEQTFSCMHAHTCVAIASSVSKLLMKEHIVYNSLTHTHMPMLEHIDGIITPYIVQNWHNFADGYFDSQQMTCFCEACHKLRGDDLYHKRGDPPRDYALPYGWCRFALRWRTWLCELICHMIPYYIL